ncbi:MAG TPA: C4-type zinc ribbon domain-containing protein [Mycobacteriales bacterium]|nr:C4-type zinc ribbon domain-containing protein [Mycobacteriales bacterium]
MKADPTAQLQLLDLQDLDSSLDRLAHQRATLPEIAELAALAARRKELDDEVTLAETELSDLGRAQAKLEADIEVVEQRQARDQKRLDDGLITNAKELEVLQHELESLARRKATLEDEELELMQSAEDAQKRVDVAAAELAEIATKTENAQWRLSETERGIDTEMASARAARSELAPSLPAELVALYEKQRAANGGVGAAALIRRRCEGCHLELAGAELNDVRAAAPDDVLRCESCGRVLVRTAESGL